MVKNAPWILQKKGISCAGKQRAFLSQSSQFGKVLQSLVRVFNRSVAKLLTEKWFMVAAGYHHPQHPHDHLHPSPLALYMFVEGLQPSYMNGKYVII